MISKLRSELVLSFPLKQRICWKQIYIMKLSEFFVALLSLGSKTIGIGQITMLTSPWVPTAANPPPVHVQWTLCWHFSNSLLPVLPQPLLPADYSSQAFHYTGLSYLPAWPWEAHLSVLCSKTPSKKCPSVTQLGEEGLPNINVGGGLAVLEGPAKKWVW